MNTLLVGPSSGAALLKAKLKEKLTKDERKEIKTALKDFNNYCEGNLFYNLINKYSK